MLSTKYKTYVSLCFLHCICSIVGSQKSSSFKSGFTTLSLSISGRFDSLLSMRKLKKLNFYAKAFLVEWRRQEAVGAKRRENFAGISFEASDWSNARDHKDPLSNDNLTS